MKSRRETWITLSEMSEAAAMSKEKLQAWLGSGKCPFGFGVKDDAGHFFCYVLRKDFEQWLIKSGLAS